MIDSEKIISYIPEKPMRIATDAVTFFMGFGLASQNMSRLGLVEPPPNICINLANSAFDKTTAVVMIAGGALAASGAAYRMITSIKPMLAVAIRYNAEIAMDFIASATQSTLRLNEVAAKGAVIATEIAAAGVSLDQFIKGGIGMLNNAAPITDACSNHRGGMDSIFTGGIVLSGLLYRELKRATQTRRTPPNPHVS